LASFLGFLLGFTIDLFCNTPGLNAATSAFIGFISRPAQGLFFTFDDYNNDQIPGLSSYMKYAFLLTLVHHVSLIILESFSYFNPKILLLRIIISTIMTSLLILAFEGFSLKKKNPWQKTI
jgi:hypothetical protein